MNQSFSKLLILISLIVLPIIFLWIFKEVIFSGENKLPTLSIVSGTHVDTLVAANGFDSIITKYPIPNFDL